MASVSHVDFWDAIHRGALANWPAVKCLASERQFSDRRRDVPKTAFGSARTDLPSTDALKPTASRYALLAVIDLLAASTAYCKPREAQALMRRIKFELMKASGSANDPLGD